MSPVQVAIARCEFGAHRPRSCLEVRVRATVYTVLGARPMARPQILDLCIGVRIPDSQHGPGHCLSVPALGEFVVRNPNPAVFLRELTWCNPDHPRWIC